MKINEIVKTNEILEKMFNSEELTLEDYEDNKQAIMQILKDKSEQIIFKNNEVNNAIELAKNLSKFYSEKAKQIEKQQEQFNEYLLFCMNQMQLNEVKTPIGKIQVKEYSKTIVDEKQLKSECYDVVYKIKTQKELKELGYEKALIKTVTKGIYIK